MIIDRERLMAIINDDDDQFDLIKIRQLHSKHSVYEAIICRGGAYFGIEYWCNYNNGLEDDEYETYEMKEIQTVDYVRVEDRT